MTMLAKVKVALRINHTFLDDDINDTINTARAELIRSGVDKELAESNIDLIQMAVKTYCQFVYAEDTKLADGYFKSWQYQLDNIRKSTIEA
ncbi:MAG: head-tail connector protein [Bacteroidales bacterium]|nr:head-tail connector protein [Candidatus Scybalousia scybalohippi]